MHRFQGIFPTLVIVCVGLQQLSAPDEPHLPIPRGELSSFKCASSLVRAPSDALVVPLRRSRHSVSLTSVADGYGGA